MLQEGRALRRDGGMLRQTAEDFDALAETLTFHAVQDMDYRGRDAVQWIAQSPVRVLEGQARGARAGAEGGIEAGLLVSRVLGLRNVAEMQLHADGADAAAPWASKRYLDQESQVWTELDLSSVIQNPQFLQVGL